MMIQRVWTSELSELDSVAEHIEMYALVPLSATMPNVSHLVEANLVSNIGVCNFPAESSHKVCKIQSW